VHAPLILVLNIRHKYDIGRHNKNMNITCLSFQRKLLDTSLGFAGGVMAAASYWSLLAPAIEMAEDSKLYGQNGEYAFVPVALGFLIGALFVYGTDFFISSLGVHSPNLVLGDLST
jgi:zinc transporter ZupT